MRTIALIAVLALPLAACGGNDQIAAPAVGEAATLASYSPTKASQFESTDIRHQEGSGLSSAELKAMSEEERREMFTSDATDSSYILSRAGLGGEYKPVLSRD